MTAEALARRCSNLGKPKEEQHRHVHLTSGRAAQAAEYSDGLCQAIVHGTIAQMEMDADGKGYVTLKEFCAWIKEGEIEMDTEFGQLLAVGDE